MSELPGGGSDFFGRIPLFREFARLLASGGGPVNWELARQVAVATAAGAEALGALGALPQPAPPPDPSERASWEERLRLAELWIDPVTTLGSGPRKLIAQPVNRPDWAEAVLPGFVPLVEPLARRLAEVIEAGAGAPREMAELMSRIGSLLNGLQVGTLVGQLAHQAVSQHELLLPTLPDPARVLIVPENVAAVERAAGLPADQFRLWLACHDVVRYRIFHSVPWLRDHVTSLMAEIARRTDLDPGDLARRIESLELGQPESFERLLEGEEGLFGPPSPALLAVTGKLEALLALAGGYAFVTCRRALEPRLPALPAIERAMRERSGPGTVRGVFAAQALRADPERASLRHGERFCHAVLAATDTAGLDRVWAHPEFLPTREELGEPGRWLERVGLVGGEEVDLETGLRRLLEEGGGGEAS